MLKNDKGVTILALLITIVILMILIGVSVNTGFSVVSDIRAGRIISNMTLVKAKVENIDEEYESYNKDTDCLVGTKVGKINELENITISSDEIKLIAEEAEVSESDVSNWEWYKWDKSILKSQGLDETMLAKNEYFYVNYEHSEIIYSSGTSYDDENYCYSMTGINNLLGNN